MSKLYLFAIGGTGSRVLRSLTMLMAAGVDLAVDEVVPIIIDPDAANADLTRTVEIMNKYSSVRQYLNFGSETKSKFFKTKLTRLLPNYLLKIKDTDDKTFQEFIDYPSMSKENKAMAKMLFSTTNLSSSMVVGFKGNPNIGSVVLNQIVGSDDFTTVANSFQAGDKIFIISSIFGGTGASGFPLLLKTLRLSKSIPNFAVINAAPIGALSILPYFRLKTSDDSEIDSSTFISKTKSALAYYEKNISNNNQINALYFLGDDNTNLYENNEGGAEQKNDAHIIEFLGATATIDFANNVDENTFTNKEFGILNDDKRVQFSSFGEDQRLMLYYPLVQFTLFCNALIDHQDRFESRDLKGNELFDKLYIKNSASMYSGLRDFFKKYREWLNEMAGNTRSLSLFNNNCGEKAFELVNGVTPRKVMKWLAGDYNLFISRLNSVVNSCKEHNTEDKYMEMYFLATHELVNKKL